MDQATYDRAAEKIQAGKIVEVNGRTASSLEELDWIQAVEDANPDPQPETSIRRAAAAHAAAEERRVAEAERNLPAAGIPPLMPDALGMTENPTTSVEGLAQAPPVNPGQAEAAESTGQGVQPAPSAAGGQSTSQGEERAATAEQPAEGAAPNPNLNPEPGQPGVPFGPLPRDISGVTSSRGGKGK